MAVVFKGEPQPLQRGDILVSILNKKQPNPTHWLIAGVTKTPYVHATLIVHPNLEWSIEWAGPRLRKAASDYECWVFRANDANWRDIGEAVAQEAMRQLPTAHKRYGYESAIFVGIQLLQQRTRLERLKSPVPYCFEGVTDLFVYKGFDPVPQIEAGAVLGEHIVNSPALIRL